MPNTSVKKYYTMPPEKCDTCQTPIGKIFYDMKTQMGPWANMCPSCAMLSPGIGQCGPGLGQEYTKQRNGKYLKTKG